MTERARKLENLQPQKDFFIGIDSDGCVFDTMEIKIKECFCPAFISNFGLQPVSKYAREVFEFVNLYSRMRGINRFKTILLVLDLLARRNEVKARDFKVPELRGLREWVSCEAKLSNATLREEIERNPDPDLKLAYNYSLEVNEAVKRIVRNVPLFPCVCSSLEKLSKQADTIVISATPSATLEKEWNDYGIRDYVRFIAGQEMGSKQEHISIGAKGKYSQDRMLVIGDSPGDYTAAESNGALFYPIIPGHEESSWRHLYEESLDRFFEGKYKEEYQERLVLRFLENLPERAGWIHT